MSEITTYVPGTPCWVDLSTPDIEASAAFYGALLGWDVPELPNSPEMGGYRRAKKDGADLAGMVPLQQEGQPPAWSTYVSVADAEATAEAVKENGGSVLFEPMDVMGLGKMAVFTDSEGGFFGIWQPGTFGGAERVNEPGALAWNELNSRDVEGAKAFYGAVFGWAPQVNDMGEMGTYTEWKLGDSTIAGMLDMAERGVPEMVPAHWQVYFAVEDTDATVAQVEQLGGGVMVPPMDVPAGRFSILTDPHGVSFAVIALSGEM
jgi:uncharacterized protein